MLSLCIGLNLEVHDTKPYTALLCHSNLKTVDSFSPIVCATINFISSCDIDTRIKPPKKKKKEWVTLEKKKFNISIENVKAT